MANEQLSAPSDYFFITEHPNMLTRVGLHARGEGMNMLGAIARGAVTLAAYDETSFGYGRDLYDFVSPLIEKLAWLDHEKGLEVCVNGYDLGKLFEPEIYSSMIEKHKERVLDQVRDGNRSAADALDEFLALEKDREILRKNKHQWFDTNGWQLRLPHLREGNGTEQGQAQPALVRVTRGTGKHYMHPTTRGALFEEVPQGAKAYAVNVMPMDPEYYWPTVGRIVTYGGEIMLHRTFGYIPKGSEEFVPVVTELSPKHPARKTA